MNRSILLFATLVACTGPDDKGDRQAGDTDVAVDTDTTNTDDTDVDTDPPAAILYIAMSVHLEGWDVTQPALFDQVTSDIAQAAAIYDEYGAKITWESKDLTRASMAQGDTTLTDTIANGHEVSIHADLGFNRFGPVDQADFIADLTDMHGDLAALTGRDPTNVSGICSSSDWVNAALEAGFTGVSGTVEYCLLSLDDVPAHVADCPSPADCHDGYPEAFEDKLHPWRTSDGGNWTVHDPAGELVIIPAATGLKCQLEAQSADSVTGCEFTAEDIDIYFEQLDEALTLLDPDQLNTFKGTYSQGEALDHTLLRDWLDRLEPYIDDGLVEWRTIDELIEMVP